jgi:predicted ATPase
MDDVAVPLLESVTLQGFLSYGPDPVTVGLEPLNVLIGPNGSGKSNFVEAFAVLRALPKDLPLPIREGGGVRDWLCKGPPLAREARLEAVFSAGVGKPNAPEIRYWIAFGAQGDAFAVLDERVENRDLDRGHPKPFFYFGYENGRPMLSVAGGGPRRALRREDIDPTQSILSQRRDPDAYPELAEIATRLGNIRIYREWAFGPQAPIRQSCRADVRSDFLSESLDNLPARLAVLKRDPDTKSRLLELLHDLGLGFDDLEIVPEGGRLQLYLMEGRHSLAAHRLSDGTLRYLALLAILLDPQPTASLVVIEEPELGLHFDMMPKIAGLLEQASRATQLVVTTHSDTLVDALSNPASILVCEREEGSSHPRRLDPEKLRPWLERDSLGTLWTRGNLGGTRW